jgi:hypothetical protein
MSLENGHDTTARIRWNSGQKLVSDLAKEHTADGERWSATLDLAVDDPYFFDHPLDHVPGMGLLEAMRQAALAIRHPEPALPLSIQAAFTHYVELDIPCLIRATTGEDGTVHVSVEQKDQVRTTGVVSLHTL